VPRRQQTGKADFIDIAMLDSLMAWTPNMIGPVFAEQRAPYPPEERSFGGNAFYRIYRTSDNRHLALSGSEQKFVVNLMSALGREDLAPLLDLRQAFDQPQVRHRRMRWQDDSGNDHIGIPICFADEPGQANPALPALGERDRKVLASAGYDLPALEASGTLLSA
jgi:crotonobetainyl-CoA:carnitine CoA-transferase CaiB-like acyl-CoA transferase